MLYINSVQSSEDYNMLWVVMERDSSCFLKVKQYPYISYLILFVSFLDKKEISPVLLFIDG